MKARNVLIAVFLLAIALPMPIQAVYDLLRGEPVQALAVFRREPTAENLRTYERGLDRDLLAAVPARRWYADGWDRVARRGNAKVVETADGWMFHWEELVFAAAPGMSQIDRTTSYGVDTEPNEAFDVIVDFHRQLEARGVRLVLVAVPQKVTVEPEHLMPDVAPTAAPNNVELGPWLNALRAKGVEVVDLSEPLFVLKGRGQPAFLPRDTHWTPAAAKASARFLAERLHAKPALGASLERTTSFRHLAVSYERKGDLVGMLSYGAEDTRFAKTPFVLDQILPSTAGVVPLGDEASPLLLLGDSFSVIYSDRSYGMGEAAGFPDHLAAELGRSIDVIAVPGGGANRAREILALRGLGPRKVVVWEVGELGFLERETRWKRIEVPPASKEPVAPRAFAPRRVHAKLTGVSRVPWKMPYADCMVVLRYEPASAGDGADPFFVATWGRRAFVETRANKYATGEVHDLTLVPLGPERALSHNCFVDDVGLDRTPYWSELRETAP